MKKIVLVIATGLGGSLSTQVAIPYSSARTFVYGSCSACGRQLDRIEWLHVQALQGQLLCKRCLNLKKKRSKEGTQKAGTLVTARSPERQACFLSGDGPLGDEASVPVQKLTRPRKYLDRVLREKRDPLWSERKYKGSFRSQMEKESQAIHDYTWFYRLSGDGDHTPYQLEVRSQKLAGVPNAPLRYTFPASVREFWYQGSSAVLVTPETYELHDFYSGDTRVFPLEEGEALERYLVRNSYGGSEQFRKHALAQPSVSADRPEHKSATVTSLLAASRKAQESAKPKVRFADEQQGGPLAVAQEQTPLFYFFEKGMARKMLLVSNEDGYVFHCALDEPVTDVLTRGMQAVLTTERGTQLWCDFTWHAHEGELRSDYPLAVLELPAQPDGQLRAQGFSRVSVKEASSDTLFEELAPTPEGYRHTVHPAYAAQELLRRIARDEQGEEDERSVRNIQESYKSSINQKRTQLVLQDGWGDRYGISVLKPEERIWQRGPQLLLPAAGDMLVLYNFEGENVETFDAHLVELTRAGAPHRSTFEEGLSELGFEEVR